MNNQTINNLRIAFFGTSRISVIVLDEMAREGILPSLIVTAPPKPKGRGLELAPSEVKVWADKHGIPTLEPKEIKSDEFFATLGTNWDLFVIASYGKIIPRKILDMPKHGTLNMHPSLLPKLRGASPIQSAILEDAPMGELHETGVTIMLIDEEVDHGPVVAQEKVTIENWPPKGSELEETLGTLGGKLLAKTIPLWVSGAITPQEQDHDQATYTKKMTKGSGHIDLADDPVRMYRKIRAFDIWPRAYFLTTRRRSLRPGRESADSEIRIIVTEARIADGKLVIDRVIPEGKKEMAYEDFLRGQK
ncbi:MAG: methionyl-tRNA formyltransferase [Patescibacteria group bacterium]